MDFRFVLIAIFFIFDVISVRSTGNSSSKKKRNLNEVQLNSSIANNSFLQLSASRFNNQNNSFLQPSNSNKNKNSFLSNGFTSQTSDSIFFPDDIYNYNPFPNNNKNPFLNPINTDSRVNNNSLLQLSINRFNTQNNSFLQSPNGNKNESSFLSNGFASQISDNIVFPDYNYNPFPNNNTNPFLNPIKTDSKVDTEFPSPQPITQRYTPLPYYHTSTSNISFNTSESPFTTSPPLKNIYPPVSPLPPVKDLLSIKIDPAKTISELKCEEYVREITGTIPMSLSSSSDVRKKNNACGNHLLADETQVAEFPHMVALGNLNESNEFIQDCGGTLISHTWVLSAAHCTRGINGSPTVVKMGTTRLTDKKGVIVAIKHMIRHPDYRPPLKYADIALIQLMNAVTFSTVIRPACLYQQYDVVPRKTWLTGWGVTEYAGERSDQLQKAQLDVVDNLFCTIRYNISRTLPYGITTSMICAGDPRGNWTKDSCQGDSGSPLQIRSEDECLFQIIGIVSFGKGCGLIETPSVYTRVSYYLPWIEDNVWPQKQ